MGSRTGVHDIAALATRRFGSALVAAAAVDHAVGLWRIAGIFQLCATEWDVESTSPGKGWPYDARAAGATFTALVQRKMRDHCSRKSKKLSHGLTVNI